MPHFSDRRYYLYFVVLLFLAVSFFSLPFITIDISTQSTGWVRSVQENHRLFTVVSGKVVQSSLEKNNQLLNKGDTLLVVETAAIQTQENLNQDLVNDYAAQIADISKLLKGNTAGLRTAVYQRQVGEYQQRLAELSVRLRQAQQAHKRSKSLFDQGVIAEIDYDKDFFELQAAQSALNTYKQQQRNTWQAEQRQLQEQTKSLGSEIQRIEEEKENYVLTAPINGRLINFSGIRKGGFVNPQMQLGELSPDAHLVAECFVLPKDIGFIEVGQSVRFQIETYNYLQWGMVKGKVIEVDENITLNEDGSGYFRVLCELEQTHLTLENGYKGEISKGMSFTARFTLTKRSLWDLLYDDINDWLNPNQNREVENRN